LELNNLTSIISLCPICGNSFNSERQTKLAVTSNELTILSNYIKNGMLKDIINIADIAMRRLDPEKINTQLQITEGLFKFRQQSSEIINTLVKEIKNWVEDFSKDSEDGKVKSLNEFEKKIIQLASQWQTTIQKGEEVQNQNLQQYRELGQTLKEIRDKIIGVGIGNIGEIITIKDLKSASPMDSFSEHKAARHGTDIIATVKQNGIECGKITISVKFVEKWDSSFARQLMNDMISDGTKFGMLVTKVFPREALNSKIWLLEDFPEKTIVYVKPEYASLFYIGLRQSVLAWYETRRLIKSKEKETNEMEQSFNLLKEWINSEEFQQSINQIDNTKKIVENARNQLTQLRNYFNVNIDKAIGFQNSIEQALIHVLYNIRKTQSFCNNESNLGNCCNETNRNDNR
jgi:hypothetical protein